MIAYVFGYASLVALAPPSSVQGRLLGYRRSWGVAMDNWDAVNDHKHFVDPESGERPALRVAYLDVDPQEGATVNGLALPVDAARLAELDAREINYDRIEVGDAFEPTDAAAVEPGASVYTYRGSAAARERHRRGVEEGNAHVSAEYAALVRDSFAALGPDALAEYERTTDPHRLPERPLRRVSRF